MKSDRDYPVTSAMLLPHGRWLALRWSAAVSSRDTAPRLARYFGTTPEFWLGLQTRFDLEEASHPLSKDIAAICPRETV